ncbi:NAD-P-binding protein [Mycena latifolia]|nr:NAD-P-binding protein [Mycena latifolia]
MNAAEISPQPSLVIPLAMSQNNFTSHTTAEELADAFAREIEGKNVLITGTSIDGIGFETARVLAKYANLVIITGYNTERLKLSEDAIKKAVPSANVRKLILDLSSLAAVRVAAAEVNAYPEPIHVLINNAAAAIAKFKVTVDNFENQMGTGHIGPFLFTNLITPKLIASTTSTYTPRVVFIASLGHALDNGVDFDTFAQPIPTKYKSIFGPYNETKSANVLAAIELSKRSRGKINAYSLHPGLIYTNIVANHNEETIADFKAYGLFDENGQRNKNYPWKTIPEGAATTVAAAFDPSLSDKPGAYLVDCKDASETIAPHSSDPANAARLWAVTEKVIGQAFEF